MIDVQTENLSFAFSVGGSQKKKVLSDVTVDISAGEHIAVIGSSGAGKTTLLRALIFANRPLSGSLKFGGVNPWKLSGKARHSLRTKLCYVPQSPPLPPRQRVVHSVIAGKLPYVGLVESLISLIHPQFTKSAFEALEEFNLAHKLYERVDQLSGGERQRVSLARAVISKAALWAVDEPLSALDPDSAMSALDVLLKHAKARGITLICTLHQVDMALRFFPRIIAMRQGKIYFDGSSSSIDQSLLMKVYES